MQVSSSVYVMVPWFLHRFKTVEETKWLYLLRVLLLGTIRTAHDMLKNRRSVVVHCSDGWDRTSQLCALVQLLLDPYARTIDGFCILVQKDWLSFGHQFQVCPFQAHTPMH